MEDVPDFSDREAVEAWLRGQPREVAITLAARAALRVVPDLHYSFSTQSPDTLALSLYVFRAVLTTSLYGVGPTEALQKVARSARDGGPRPLRDSAAHTSALGAVAAAARVNTYGQARAAVYALEIYPKAAASDADLLAAGIPAETLANSPLWHIEDENYAFQRSWSHLRAHLLDANEHWDFWIDWYERHLHGRPQDWDLLERIALIPDEHWQRGPAHVNALIETLKREAEPQARQQARAAFEAAEETLGPRLSIGANFPPEPIGETDIPDSTLRQWIEDLPEALEALRRLLYANVVPSRAVVETCVERLRKGLTAMVVWLGGKADLAVNTTIQSGIDTAIRKILPMYLGVDAVLHGQASVLANLHLHAERWLQTLPFP